MKESIKEYYQAAQVSCTEEIKKCEDLINQYSFLRLGWIFIGLVLFYQSFKFHVPLITELAVLFIVFVFGWLVKQQSISGKKKDYFTDLKKINANELNSISKLDTIYPDGSVWEDGSHPYSSDLDIFGRGSLFKLINRCSTAVGNNKLAGWLKAPAKSSVISERQSAVKELSSKLSWKLHFQAILLFANTPGEDHADKLFQYMKQEPHKREAWLILYIRWIPCVFGIVFIAAFWVHYLFLLILIIGAGNLTLWRLYLDRISQTSELTSKLGRILVLFSEAITAVKEEKWESDLCIRLAENLKDNQQGKISQQIKRLSMLINNMTLPALVSLPLNIIMVWDIRYLFLIEDWRQESKANLEEAFDVITSFEALISISSLNSNYSDWCFPEIVDQDQYTLTATDISHPLIPANLRISNSFSLNNELKIDIITGSNMAGKSTFLRTLGINTVLALAGAPVCAKAMSVTPMLVFSYMRISDSLNESTSTFKAELDRLRSLLEILEKEKKVYFLIDEMLRGTNSVDKYLGSKAVIERLIEQKAVGIVATHDLQIAKLEETYPDYVRNFYFDISIEGNEMIFDYKLKAGECKTFNASMLLRQLGIITK